MDNSNRGILREKSYRFALRTVSLYKFLASEQREYVLSKQVLRSGTSIGANIAEARQGQSKADFIHKLSISLKETYETEYWIDLLRDSEYISPKQASSLLEDCYELQRLLTASIKTAKNNSSRTAI
jgi:four helix bundle protein